MYEFIILVLVAGVTIGVLINRLVWTYRPPPKEPPQISISAGSIKVDEIVFPTAWDPAIEERDFESDFQRFMLGKTIQNLEYVRNGRNVTIRFRSKVPDMIELTEYIISEDGELRDIYNGVMYEKIQSVSPNRISFRIEPNWATALGSFSGDYTPGHTIKGYRVVCTWGDKECEYLFVIRSDAGTGVFHG